MQVKPKVNIEREEINDREVFAEASDKIKAAGKSLESLGLRYMGSLAVHYYEVEGAEKFGRYDLILKSQSALAKELNEKQIDAGIKELNLAMKRKFGFRVSE